MCLQSPKIFSELKWCFIWQAIGTPQFPQWKLSFSFVNSLFWDRVLCSQASLEFMSWGWLWIPDPPVFTFQVLWSKIWATMSYSSKLFLFLKSMQLWSCISSPLLILSPSDRLRCNSIQVHFGDKWVYQTYVQSNRWGVTDKQEHGWP